MRTASDAATGAIATLIAAAASQISTAWSMDDVAQPTTVMERPFGDAEG
jgi:hypothetical protein